MESIWVIISESGIVRRKYGWYETKEECDIKCRELGKEKSACFLPYELKRALKKGTKK
ncbi:MULTISPECIES: hypothetical protein [Bacillus subtilis group]|uniref:hypothetical protein n=1 Tax=Bacillus subtilis group TaxID=653685 RepID=UPI000CA90C44|nr:MULTISPECIES: hypothetical protein [Bacillus subtilis group]MEA3602971.1 hypothetical protein [Bacillus subtilis]MEC2062666.1 hypothetical protein [Bacillus inaquosorum]MEC2086191.1 hypothetical protein [Bacillus inaquosorum]PLV32144.1 hypothetical protein BSP4_31200 [Bacillus subtilis subsp. subtilis]